MSSIANTLAFMPRKLKREDEKKVPIAARVDPKIKSSFEAIAQADDRTFSFMVERAMKLFLESVHANHSKRSTK